MRIRSIKPEFFTSHDTAGLDYFDRLLFIGLWCYVDDNGVGENIDWKIAAALFPSDLASDSSGVLRRISGGLRRLSALSMVTLYEASGRPLMHITHWERHQRVSHPGTPRYMTPDEASDKGVLSIPEDLGRTPEDLGRTPEILVPDQGTGNRDQGSGIREARLSSSGSTALELVDATAPADAGASPTPKTRRGSRLPDGWQPARSDANLNAEQAFDPAWLTDQLARFRDYWAGVTGVKGTKLDWDATWRNWIRRSGDERRSKRRGNGPDWDALMAHAASDDHEMGLT